MIQDQTLITIIIAIASGALGSLITAFALNRNADKDRKYSFRKEHFYKQQEKADEIIDSIVRNKMLVERYISEIKNGLLTIAILNEEKAEKMFGAGKLFNNICIFFPDLMTEYETYVKSITMCTGAYFAIAKRVANNNNSALSDKEMVDVVEATNNYYSAQDKFVDSFIRFISSQKSKLDK